MQFSPLDFKMNDMWRYELYQPRLINIATLRRQSQNTKNPCEHNVSF